MSKKLKYLVLQAIGLGGDHCPRGSHVELSQEDALNIGSDYVQLVEGQNVEKKATVIVEEPAKETVVVENVETEDVEEESETVEETEDTPSEKTSVVEEPAKESIVENKPSNKKGKK